MKKRIIAICTSVTFYKQALDVEKDLRKLGFLVKIPTTAYVMKKTGVYGEHVYKTWYKDKKEYFKKTEVMLDHFKKVLQSDAILDSLPIAEEVYGLRPIFLQGDLSKITL